MSKENEHEATEECPRCHNKVAKQGVLCVKCNCWWHYSCCRRTKEEIENLENEEFACFRCIKKEVEIEKQNNSGETSISEEIIKESEKEETSIVEEKIKESEKEQEAIRIKQKDCEDEGEKEKRIVNKISINGKEMVTGEQKDQTLLVNEDQEKQIEEGIADDDRRSEVEEEKTLTISDYKDKIKELEKRETEREEKWIEKIKDHLEKKDKIIEEMEETLQVIQIKHKNEIAEKVAEMKKKDKEVKNLKEEVINYKGKFEENLAELLETKRISNHLCHSLDNMMKVNEDLVCQNVSLKEVKEKETESGEQKEKRKEKNDEMCRYDKEGYCRRGKNCNFKHDSTNSKELCKYVRQNTKCNNEKCTYRHIVQKRKYKDFICKNQATNSCKFKEKCRYYHIKQTNSEKLSKPAEKEEQMREKILPFKSRWDAQEELDKIQKVFEQKSAFMEERIMDVMKNTMQQQQQQQQQKEQFQKETQRQQSQSYRNISSAGVWYPQSQTQNQQIVQNQQVPYPTNQYMFQQ